MGSQDIILVSIILPTYNVEKYLDKCLLSVSKQSYSNIEVIIVIDGATDNSYNIAKSWELKDNRIQVICQENSGSGPARNNGLSHANGEFIMFVDPDDWIDEDMVLMLINYQQRHNADLVVAKSRTVDSQGNIIFEESESGKLIFSTKVDVRNNYLRLLGLGLLGAPTRKLYRMELIRKYNIKFPDLRRSQDIVFNYRYYDIISCVVVVDDICYNYLVDNTTYTRKLKEDYYKTLSYIFTEICEYCNKWNVRLQGDYFISACNYLFHSVVANLEANNLRNQNILQIISDEGIRCITEGSNPKRIDEILLKKCIMRRRENEINLILKIRLFLKKVKYNFRKVGTSEIIKEGQLLNKTNLRRLQLTQLEILKEVKRICDENEIKYFLADGTLLGAVRHKGFIPWDDDLDIAMPRKEYNRFLEIAPFALKSEYFLQTWMSDSKYPFPYAKILKKGTQYTEAITQGTGVCDGIFIDVFPIDSCGSKEEMSRQLKWYLLWTKVLLMKSGYKVWKATGAKNCKIKYVPFILLSYFFSRESLIAKINNIIEEWNIKYCDRGYVFENCGYNFVQWILKKKYFEDFTILKFEDMDFSCPKDYKGYLRDVYDNYMKLPPENERYNRHNILKLKF